jgi:hypothetical protein
MFQAKLQANYAHVSDCKTVTPDSDRHQNTQQNNELALMQDMYRQQLAA